LKTVVIPTTDIFYFHVNDRLPQSSLDSPPWTATHCDNLLRSWPLEDEAVY